MADDEKAMIEREAASNGFPIKEWRNDEENGLTAVFEGRFRVIEDDEDRGFYEGDEGILEACVVGAAEHRNQRVDFSFTPDDYDSGNSVYDISILDPV